MFLEESHQVDVLRNTPFVFRDVGVVFAGIAAVVSTIITRAIQVLTARRTAAAAAAAVAATATATAAGSTGSDLTFFSGSCYLPDWVVPRPEFDPAAVVEAAAVAGCPKF